MKFLRLETAKKWMAADEEIAKVRFRCLSHSSLQMADISSMLSGRATDGLQLALRTMVVSMSWLEWKKPRK